MNPAAKIIEEYPRVLMIPDPEAARRYCAPGMQIRFTGNRLMRDPYSAEWLLVRAGLAKP